MKTSITGNTKTLNRFGDFPREIQIKIFKCASLAPRIVYLRLEVIFSEEEEGIIWAHLRVNKNKATDLLSLLEICTTPNASVYCGGGFTKIKIEPLGTCSHVAHKAHKSFFDMRFFNERFCNKRLPYGYKEQDYKLLNDTYVRPSEDILGVDLDMLTLLCAHGGSLDLESLTHIAVSRSGYLSVRTPLVSIYVTRLLSGIHSHYPCLKRLSVVSSNSYPRILPPATRLLSINKDLLKLDLRDKDERQVPSGYADDRYQKLEKTLKSRSLFDRHFESYRKGIEKEGNKNAIDYWQKVELVNVLHCWPDDSQDELSLYIPELDSYVRCNDGGFLGTLPESTPDSLIQLGIPSS
ncbi:hypothetical protein EAE96_006232 [Botrytis aclada]|nr:hypothetical protein EAE96_006232 [Botrytis aclada]